MVFLVELKYPNGRRHDAVLDRPEPLVVGSEFEMFGHRWRVTGLADSRHADRFRRKVDPKAESTRALCVRVD
jgi:hypothetical protein